MQCNENPTHEPELAIDDELHMKISTGWTHISELFLGGLELLCGFLELGLSLVEISLKSGYPLLQVLDFLLLLQKNKNMQLKSKTFFINAKFTCIVGPKLTVISYLLLVDLGNS
jgi:hypothetical protein